MIRTLCIGQGVVVAAAFCAALASAEARADSFQLVCKGEISVQAGNHQKTADLIRVELSLVNNGPEAVGFLTSNALGKSELVFARASENEIPVSGVFKAASDRFQGSINRVTTIIGLILNEGAATWVGNCAKADRAF